MPNTSGRFPVTYPAGNAPLVPWQGHFQNLAQSVSDALENAKVPVYVTNATDRLAKFPSPTSGDRVYRGDYKREEIYDGTAWVSNQPGLQMLRPTSASGSGVTLGTNSRVAAAGATSIAVNGAFSSSFLNYCIVIGVTHADTGIAFQLRNGGTAVSGNYQYAYLWNNGSTPTVAQNTGQSNLTLSVNAMLEHYVIINLRNPAAAAPTLFNLDSTSRNTSTQYMAKGAGQHTASIACDGFTVSASQGMTGSVSVYAWG